MAAKEQAKVKELPVRIIATPGSLKATCGFCLRYDVSQEAAVQQVIAQGKWPLEGWYHAWQEGLNVTYQLLKEAP